MPVEEEEREVKISDYYYKKSDIDTQMNNKVDKDGNKVLSDNNYTNADKAKLTNMIPTDYVTSQSLSSTLSSYVVTSTLNNYYTQSEIDNIVNTINNNKISKSQTAGLVKNDGTIDTTTYSTASHTHGNLQTNGAIGTSNNANKNVITDANGQITTENKPTIPTKTSDLTNDGDGTNVFVKDNDSRLTNSRTPTNHNHGNITNNGKVIVHYDAIVQGTALIADDNDDGTLKTGLLSNAYIYDTSSLQNIDNNLDGNTEVSQENVNILINAKIGDIDTALNNKINKSSTTGLVKNDGTIDTNTYLTSHQDITGKENISNKTSNWNSTTNNTRYPTEKLVKDSLDNKVNVSDIKDNLISTDVDKPLSANQGKVLSDNKEDKTNKTTSISSSSTHTQYPSAKAVYDDIYTSLNNRLNSMYSTSFSVEIVEGVTSDDLLSVAGVINGESFYFYATDSLGMTLSENTLYLVEDVDESGVYYEFILIPPNTTMGYVATAEMLGTTKPNLQQYIKKSTTNGLVKNDGTIDTNIYLTQHQDISGKEDKSNKVTQWSSIVTDTNYPSEKLVISKINEVGSNFSSAISGIYSYLNNYQTKNMYVRNKNIVTDNSGYITTEDKPTIPSASSTTPSADTTSGNVGTGTTWAKADHTHPKSSLYAEASHTHNNYLTSHQDITGKEDNSNKSSSITTDAGSTTKYPTVKAVEDYAQPKGNYLTSHQDISGKADSSDFDTLTATVNYTDNTSETVTFYIAPSNNSG